MDQSSIAKLVGEHKDFGSGGGATGDDRGLHSGDGMDVIGVVVQLETLVNSKYPAQTSSQNYKGLSKRIIQSIKSKADQRT